MPKYNVTIWGTFSYHREGIKAKNTDEIYDIFGNEFEKANIDIDDVHDDEIEQL